jgi:hypothetical protein
MASDITGVNITIDDLNSQRTLIYLPNTICMCFVLLDSYILNSIVIWIRWGKMKKTYDLRKYIPYLSLCDLISSIVAGTVFLYDNLNSVLWQHALFCKLGNFAVKITQCASLLFVLFIAVQRYLKICHFSEHGFTKTIKALVLLACVFVLSIKSFPEIVLYQSAHEWDKQTGLKTIICTHSTKEHKWPNLFIAIDNILMLLIVSVIVFVYMLIAEQLKHRSRTATKKSVIPKEQEQTTNNRKRKEYPNDIYYHTIGSSFIVAFNGSPISTDAANATIRINPNAKCKQNEHQKQKYKNMKSMTYSSNSNMPKVTWESSSTSDSCQRAVTNAPTVNSSTSKFETEKFAHSKHYHQFNIIKALFVSIALITIIGYLPEIVLRMLEITQPTLFSEVTNVKRSIVRMLKRLYIVTYVTNSLLYNIVDVTFMTQLRCCVREIKMCRSQT